MQDHQPPSTTQPLELIQKISEIIVSTRSLAFRSVDMLQVSMNFAIGQRIVEHEQEGEQRAKYGQRTLELLADTLTHEFGKGFSLTNLKLMRQFYLTYHSRIGQTASDQSLYQVAEKTLSIKLPALSPISWSHYCELLILSDKNN